MLPVVRELAGRGRPGQRRHDERRHRASPPSRRAPRSSTTSPAGSPTPRWRRSRPRPAPRYVAMHWRGHSDRHGRARRVRATSPSRCATSSRARVDAARRPPGVARDRLILDPGLGFAKRGDAELGAARPARRARRRSGCPCSSAPRASGSSARCCPERGVRRRPRPADGRRQRARRRRPAPGRCACTTCRARAAPSTSLGAVAEWTT